MPLINTSIISRISKHFIVISKDNRIHIWDTDSRVERRSYVEKNHLSHSYVCYDWFQPKEGFNEKSKMNSNLGRFAIGCSDGSIIIWDFVRGVVIQNLNHSIAPTDILFSHDGLSLFVSSSNNIIKQYHIDNATIIKEIKIGKKNITRLARNPVVDVLAIGGLSVRLLDIETDRKRKFEASFSGGIHALTFTDCGFYLVCNGQNSKEVLIFDIQASAQSDDPIAVLTIQDNCHDLMARKYKSKELISCDIIEILCIYEHKDAIVLRYVTSTNKNNSVEGNGNTNITQTKILTPTRILSACFGKPGEYVKGKHTENSDESVAVTDNLTVVIGTETNPLFHTVKMKNDMDYVKIIQISSDSHASEIGSPMNSKDDTMKSSEVILGPYEMGTKKRPLHAIEDGEDLTSHSVKKSLSIVDKDGMVYSASENGLNYDSKNKIIANGTINSNELTLQQRLENLSSEIIKAFDSKDDRQHERAEDDDQDGMPPTEFTSDSLVVLVEQALQAGDDNLLEECLNCVNDNVVETTTMRIKVERIVPLLKTLVSKFEKRPSRGLLLTRWLKGILKHHTSYLITVPDLSHHLTALSQMLESRLSTYTKLAGLGGRLDLLMHQIHYPSLTSSDQLTHIDVDEDGYPKPLALYDA